MLTPYPVDVPAWDYSIPLAARSGIFLGTREFAQPSRNHLAALTLALRAARHAGTHVTVINSEKRTGRALIQALSTGLPAGCLRVIEGRLSYDAYLRTMAAHRVVFQLDRSSVPGQVAGDALLCRSVCAGGNSAIELAAFPEHSSPALLESSMELHLTNLLQDDQVLEKAIAASQRLARERLSFAACAGQLARVFAHRTN